MIESYSLTTFTTSFRRDINGLPNTLRPTYNKSIFHRYHKLICSAKGLYMSNTALPINYTLIT